MLIELNHTTIHVADGEASARFSSDVLQPRRGRSPSARSGRGLVSMQDLQAMSAGVVAEEQRLPAARRSVRARRWRWPHG